MIYWKLRCVVASAAVDWWTFVGQRVPLLADKHAEPLCWLIFEPRAPVAVVWMCVGLCVCARVRVCICFKQHSISHFFLLDTVHLLDTEHLHGFQISVIIIIIIISSNLRCQSCCTFTFWKSLSLGFFSAHRSMWALVLCSCYSGVCRCPARGCQPHKLPCAQVKGVYSCRGWPQMSSLLWKPETSAYIFYLFACMWLSLGLIVERI